ncbi:thioredoxin-like 4, chloroplastic [Canna indica]|uniref:Thioredoxin-like 4, chloroplastic n=1 Tax=Canna indica TaxID=4628 RepID=A0AAQ3Q0N7_9LILI|nr:thioredoxin-like 4, chloroplastic [Canna indica]
MSSSCLFSNPISNVAVSPLRPSPRLLSPRNPSHVRFHHIHKRMKLKKNRRSLNFHLNAIVDPVSGGDGEEEEEDDVDLCPVDCVKEFKTEVEFSKILEKAKANGSLVVVDFYRTSCGSCKYIEQGFAKLCKGSGDGEADVVYLKHNVIDEYDEQSEVAERLRIRSVPLFHFYKNGVLLEAFPTRDKERIVAAILKYSSSYSSS